MVSRLCAPIDGTDPARLAHCLGLDDSRFHKQVQSSAAQAREEIQLTGTACCDDEDRYRVSWLQQFLHHEPPCCLQNGRFLWLDAADDLRLTIAGVLCYLGGAGTPLLVPSRPS